MGRPTSIVEFPDKRHRLDRDIDRHTRDSDVSDDYRRRRSPSYDSYECYTDCGRSRRRSESPERRSPRHNNGTLNDNVLPKKFGRGDYRRNGAYLDRNRGSWRSDSDSDDELNGLSFEEYRRQKRQKLRKLLKRCIWNVTPSPPRDENEVFEDKAEEISEKYGDDGIGKTDSSDKETRHKSESKSDSESVSQKSWSSESESSSESGDSRLRKKRRKSSGSKRRSSKLCSDNESDDSESESESEEDRKLRKGTAKSRRKSSKRRRDRRKRKLSDSDESERSDSSSASDDRVKSKKNRKRPSGSPSKRRGKRRTETERDSSYSAESSGAEADAKSKTKEDDLKNAEINAEALKFKELIESQKKPALDNEPAVGPMPLPRAEGHISYGGALRPGEGDAIAQYVQQGKRILSEINLIWPKLFRSLYLS